MATAPSIKSNTQNQKKNERIEDSDEESEDEMVLKGAKTTDIQEEYTVQAVFGSGGFSTVYTAVDNSNGDVVAIKHIVKYREEPDRMMPWDLHKQYLANEVQTLLRLSGCPNVVQLYDIYEDAGNIFMVFELIDGEELFDMICANGFYSEHEAVEILRAVCRGLKACHDRNVMHRDIKPENIMCPITDNNTHDLSKATIIDFGLAAILEPGTYATEASGSPGYVAPEILVGCPYDRAVDMWSLGVTAYILLAGYPPWVEDIEVPVEDQIIAGDYEFHSPEWDDVSSTAKDWIRRLLVLDPTKRMTVSEALQHPFLKLSVAPAQIKVEYADSSKPVKKSDVPPPIVKPANTKPKSESSPNIKPASKPDKPPVEVVKPAVHKPTDIKPLDIPIEVISGKGESSGGSARTVKPSPRVTSPRLQIQTVLPPQRKSTLVSVTEETDHKHAPAQQSVKEPASTPTQKLVTPVKETPKDTHKETASAQKPAAAVTEKPAPEKQPVTPVRSVVVEKPAPAQTPVPVKTQPEQKSTPAASTPTDQTKTKKCPKCSAQIAQGVKICGQCSHKMDAAAGSTPKGATTYSITTSNTPSSVPKTVGTQQAGPSPVFKRFGYKAPDHISNIPVIKEQASQTTQVGYRAPDHITNIPVIKEQITQKTGQGYVPPDHIKNIPVIREQAQKSVLHKYIPPDHTTNIPIVKEIWDPVKNEFLTVKAIVQSPSLSAKPKFPKRGQGKPLRGKRADATNDKENKI